MEKSGFETLIALAEKASPGPWSITIEREYGEYGGRAISAAITGVRSTVAEIVRFADDYGNDQMADGKFIAAANPEAVVRLARYAVALESERDRLRIALAQIAGGEPGVGNASVYGGTVGSVDCDHCEEFISAARDALAVMGPVRVIGMSSAAKEKGDG